MRFADLSRHTVSITLAALSLVACGDGGGTATAATTNDPATSASVTGDPTDGTEGGPPGSLCSELCQTDEDCFIGGEYKGFDCVGGLCGSVSFGNCATDLDCQLFYSGWLKSCASQGECFIGGFCIDIGGGEGRCADGGPSDVGLECAAGLVELLMPPIEGGRDVTVCGHVDHMCIDHVCERPCMNDGDCNSIPGLPHCSVGTGQCECTSDADCLNSGEPGLTVCKTTYCGCASDADCTGSNMDRCFDSFCGCTSDAVCTSTFFDGAELTCQPR